MLFACKTPQPTWLKETKLSLRSLIGKVVLWITFVAVVFIYLHSTLNYSGSHCCVLLCKLHFGCGCTPLCYKVHPSISRLISCTVEIFLQALHYHCGCRPTDQDRCWHRLQRCSSFEGALGPVFVAGLMKRIPFRQRTIEYLLAEVALSRQVVEINSLELELHSLLSEHMEALLVQRRQRIKETANRLQQLSCKNCLCVCLCN